MSASLYSSSVTYSLLAVGCGSAVSFVSVRRMETVAMSMSEAAIEAPLSHHLMDLRLSLAMGANVSFLLTDSSGICSMIRAVKLSKYSSETLKGYGFLVLSDIRMSCVLILLLWFCLFLLSV